MPRLTPAQLHQRLRLDERTMAMVNLDAAPVQVTGHRTVGDARSGANAIAPESTETPPEHYRVVYDFPTLRAKGAYHRPTVVHFDLLGGGGAGYPFSEPVCRVVGTVVPWTPHFHPAYPICIGSGWRADGQTLAVDLVVHIQKLLNFAEPKPVPGYDGWNGDAIRWWTKEHGCRPLDPDLVYPFVDPNRAEARSGRRFGAARAPRRGRFRPAEREAAARRRFAARGGAR